MKKILPIVYVFMIAVVILASALGGAIADRLFVIKPLNALFPNSSNGALTENVIGGAVAPENVLVNAHAIGGVGSTTDIPVESCNSVITVTHLGSDYRSNVDVTRSR